MCNILFTISLLYNIHTRTHPHTHTLIHSLCVCVCVCVCVGGWVPVWILYNKDIINNMIPRALSMPTGNTRRVVCLEIRHRRECLRVSCLHLITSWNMTHHYPPPLSLSLHTGSNVFIWHFFCHIVLYCWYLKIIDFVNSVTPRIVQYIIMWR